MALNLAGAGVDLVVWNRTPERTAPLREAGAAVADTVDEVFARTRTVLVMLVNEDVTDQVLGRGTADFPRRVSGHLIISTGSVSPEYSRGLAADVRAAGGRFVESPVSGSRGPAEAGTLVALLGGEPDDVRRAAPLLAPMTREAIWCGPIGNGLLMKLSVNHYLNVMLAALAEATHFADSHGLDRALLQQAIMVGPMASELAGVKLAQLVSAGLRGARGRSGRVRQHAPHRRCRPHHGHRLAAARPRQRPLRRDRRPRPRTPRHDRRHRRHPGPHPHMSSIRGVGFRGYSEASGQILPREPTTPIRCAMSRNEADAVDSPGAQPRAAITASR